MRRVEWTDASTVDLRGIRAYLTETYSPLLAQRVIDERNDWRPVPQ